MAKRYDILCLPPQDKPVYFVVEAFLPDDLETTEYHYEEGGCPSDHFHKLDTIIIDGDADPHGLFEYVRTTGEIEFPNPHNPDIEWAKIVPEAFDPTLNLKAEVHLTATMIAPPAEEAPPRPD